MRVNGFFLVALLVLVFALGNFISDVDWASIVFAPLVVLTHVENGYSLKVCLINLSQSTGQCVVWTVTRTFEIFTGFTLSSSGRV